MKKHLFFAFMMLVSASMFFASCSKDDDKSAPTLSFKTGTGYTSANATVNYNDTVKIGILATSNGSDNIVKFVLKADDQVIMDSTLNAIQVSLDFSIVKGASASETWKFTVTDAAGKITESSIVLSRPSTEITTYNAVKLGAQDNTTDPSFFSTSDGSTYFQGDAYNNQAKIDMFCFYENTTSHQNFTTLGAPGSNITGIFTGGTAPDNYDVKNVTYFVKTILTPAQFDAVTNDEGILQSFDPSNQFKKAKNLQTGDVWAFKTQSGKFGLLKVTSVVPETNGSLEMAVKIQK